MAPVLFVSHGSPDVALEDSPYTRALTSFGREAGARAVVVVSAHWEAPAPVRVSSSQRNEVVHDFGGFPPELYRLDYPAPGDPTLSSEIVRSLQSVGIEAAMEPAHALDHGAWVPLRFLYPRADVPVVAVSLPRPRTPLEVARLGEALAPLRDRGVLLLASGGTVHNLARLKFGEKRAPEDSWAVAFEEWLSERLARREIDRILDYRSEAPGARLAAPSTEHFDPIFVALGAARPDDAFRPLYDGIEHGNLSLRTFAFQPSLSPSSGRNLAVG